MPQKRRIIRIQYNSEYFQSNPEQTYVCIISHKAGFSFFKGIN